MAGAGVRDILLEGPWRHRDIAANGIRFHVAVGEQFGPGNRFELRSVSGNCGTFVFGDQSFTLCITPSK